jgi:dihydrofolate synthase/folylpolyglutamate synthase
MIPKDFVVDFVENYKNLFEQIKPSFFEWTVALCFHYFAVQKIEIAIIETGLGGRLDSTNIINPILSVITNIGYDHMDMLGKTLELIAGEKAGIIKQNTPVIIGEKHIETTPVFNKKAKEEHAHLCFAEFETELLHFKNNEIESYFDIHLRSGETWLNMQCDLPGIYQKKNICTVISCMPFIRQVGFKIEDKDIKNGLFQVKKNTGLMGRWQLIQNSPKVICDTGHNEHGIRLVTQQLSQVKRKNLRMLIGMVKDKDVSKILSLMPQDATYYFTKAKLPRALDEKELQALGVNFHLKGSTYSDVESAIKQALLDSTKDDLIFIGASTFIVAEAMEFFQK